MKRWFRTYFFLLSYLFFDSIDSTILLYDTSNRPKTQAYDCMYYDGSGFDGNINPETTQSVKYCIRSNEFVSIDRHYSQGCSNEGVLLSFQQLKQLNITMEELLKWNSGVDVLDRYQAYLQSNEAAENLICNCTKPGSFGILCEYQFSHETFEETIKYQFDLKNTYQIGSQLYGNTTCYNTSFHCDYGMRCLDWRHICDRKQQCVDGTDEDYCEHLLFNECDSNTEYRCRNGMCIDEEYFLDGDIDCQDRSDEQLGLLNELGEYCPFVPNMECDEHIPYAKYFFSCGDGEMMYERALSLREVYGSPCKSFRDKQWMCELDMTRKMWTNPENGHCLDIVDHTIDIKEANDCIFIIKCALTGSNQHPLCPCTGNDCHPYLSSTCHLKETSLYSYPPGRVFTPFVETTYDLKLHDFNKVSQPDYYMFTESIKCNSELRAIPDQTYYKSYMEIQFYLAAFPWQPFEYFLCDMYYANNPNSQPHVHCWNDTYPNQAVYCLPDISFDCISKYQINDGVDDCQFMEDYFQLLKFGNCSSIRKHRFQCPDGKPSCTTVLSIKNGIFECSPIYSDDEIYGTQKELKDKRCENKGSDDCRFIRQYIAQSSEQSSINVSSSNVIVVENVEKGMKFWSHCDSIWDMSYGIDEMNCDEWKCHPSRRSYQCQSGQCIPFDWLCNGEWDCSDGSDEEGFQLLTEHTLGEHNLKMIQNTNSNLKKQKEKCLSENSPRPFPNLCNRSYEYPCLLANVVNPLNLTLNRPCINLTQLGDGRIDCYGELDERNVLHCSAHNQLGFNFPCGNSDECVPAIKRCSSEYRCQNNENRFICFYALNNTFIENNSLIDILGNGTFFNVHCLNGSYIPKARCNQLIECQFGEDELYCPREHIEMLISKYREYSLNASSFVFKIILANYLPLSSVLNEDQLNHHNKNMTIKSESLIGDVQQNSVQSQLTPQEKAYEFSKEGWICNRGILAWKYSSQYNQRQIQCFCPPSYYGQWCQWMSDRLTVFTHFYDPTKSISKGVIKILALLIGTTNDITTVLDHHEYHFTPALQNLDKKHKFYFVYPRPHHLRSNRSSYAVRFEVYLLNDDETIDFLAVWIYPIPFHFLPSQRLAKVLKYIPQPQLNINHTCSSIPNPCSINGGKCHPLMNKLTDIHSYWCECGNGSYGKHCQFKDQSCLIQSTNITPCSRTSLCRRKYDQNGEKALCICSIHSYGPGCYLNRYCQMNKDHNPCLNGGKCLDNYQHSNSFDAFACQCSQNYFGSRCEEHSATIHMIYNHQNQSFNSSHDTILATGIQLFDINDKQELLLRKQTVYKQNLPFYSKIIYGDHTLPVFGLIKLYTNKSTIHYHLLYSTSTNQQSFNLTIIFNEQNYCPHTSQIFQQPSHMYLKSNLVAKYHTLCDQETNRSFHLLCFRDDHYLCFCDVMNLTQCLLYNQKWDQCQHCLARGQCILGDRTINENYLCLCPRCYYGERCQHNTQVLSFTLESLFSADLFSSSLTKQKVSFIMYIITPVLLSVYGIINNLFAFVTFRRPKPRLNGIGHYLLVSSIVAQLSLIFLIGKIAYILIGIQGFITQTICNLILCKTLSYLLSSSTRIYYWLTAFVTIERVYVTKYPRKTWLKQPKIAQIIIVLIFMITLGSHVHELMEYMIVNDSKYIINGTWCVTEYTTVLKVYNQTNTFLHYLVPFLINIICTIYLTILIVRSRANVDKKKGRSQLLYTHLKTKKEIFVPSLMILVSALPQLIISFSLACTDLDIKWERYLLIVAYFVSYAPQISTFHLYVQPSTFFLSEFYSTNVGITLKQTMNIKPKK